MAMLSNMLGMTQPSAPLQKLFGGAESGGAPPPAPPPSGGMPGAPMAPGASIGAQRQNAMGMSQPMDDPEAKTQRLQAILQKLQSGQQPTPDEIAFVKSMMAEQGAMGGGMTPPASPAPMMTGGSF